MKLSIIIPYYNVPEYTAELLDRLAPQITPEVEVILVDDGSREPFKTDYKWCKVVRQVNHGVSHARNKGLSMAKGEYIAFLDADDLVAPEYVSKLFSKMPFDYLEMSWKSLPGGQQFEYRLNSQNDRLSNPSAVTRVFNRNIIGETRFNEYKQAAEDAEFVREVCKPDMNVAVIPEFMYFYRTYTPNSLTKRYSAGDTETKRIVYHYPTITANMTSLLEEVKRENERNEVYILTEKCEIPELYNYAKVMRPCQVRGYELRGEPTPLFTKILPPPFFDIVIYTGQKTLNGIYTWINAFCHNVGDTYDIAVIHDGFSIQMREQLQDIAYVRRNGEPIKCKTLLMMRIGDTIPSNIRYETAIQILHAPKLDDSWVLPKDRDRIIPVSKAVKESWGLDEEPILNMTYSNRRKGELHLISATRLNTKEKGVERMRKFVERLNQAHIPFKWDCYSETNPNINGITHKDLTVDIRQHIRSADYLVQLSDGEGFCYSIVEALEEGTAVITTPMEVLSEIGFEENRHGYIFGFDLSGDMERLRKIPEFKYQYNNIPSRWEWAHVLGKRETEINPPVTITCTRQFRDMQLERQIQVGEKLTLNHRRAEEIISCGYATKTD